MSRALSESVLKCKRCECDRIAARLTTLVKNVVPKGEPCTDDSGRTEKDETFKRIISRSTCQLLRIPVWVLNITSDSTDYGLHDSPPQRQHHRKSRALPQSAGYVDAALMVFHDAASQREAEARAVTFRRVERAKDVG